MRCGLKHKFIIWLIPPLVICLSQRLNHACLSISFYTVVRMAVLRIRVACNALFDRSAGANEERVACFCLYMSNLPDTWERGPRIRSSSGQPGSTDFVDPDGYICFKISFCQTSRGPQIVWTRWLDVAQNLLSARPVRAQDPGASTVPEYAPRPASQDPKILWTRMAIYASK